MENKDHDYAADQPLSNNPEENLRMENELLRLKLQAELGAEPHSMAEIDPEIENFFLKNVLDFEHNYAASKQVKVFDLLGRPDFKRADQLTDDAIGAALTEMEELLLQNNMEVDFAGDYDDRTKYTFITAELFEHETNDMKIPGMITHFCYEEFHPNHELDIKNRTEAFFSEWFKQSFSETSWELADHFILPDRRILSKADILKQMQNIFAAYSSFTDEHYVIKEIRFELQNGTGLGHTEGLVKYDAILESGETLVQKGPFKLYFSLEDGWWSIFHIVFPGFKYH